MEFGVHWGAATDLAIAQLHSGGHLRGAIGLPIRSTSVDLELLTCDFGATVNVVLRVVSVEEIIRDLP
jgi:hypothetical protein